LAPSDVLKDGVEGALLDGDAIPIDDMIGVLRGCRCAVECDFIAKGVQDP